MISCIDSHIMLWLGCVPSGPTLLASANTFDFFGVVVLYDEVHELAPVRLGGLNGPYGAYR